jgi:hypothetical protein
MSSLVDYANLCTFAERNFLENSMPINPWKNLLFYEKTPARYNWGKQYCL